MSGLAIRPLTAERWDDFETLFGANGACGGCWCMTWRLTRRQYEESKGSGNRSLMKQLVDTGSPPGLLAYQDSQPVGWCALGPREGYSTLSRSRILKPVDDTPVWSVVCFFIAREFRRQGLSSALLRAAAEYVRFAGGKMLEGYPVDPRKPEMPDLFAYTGLLRAFQKAGFEEVARRSETRPIMRLVL